MISLLGLKSRLALSGWKRILGWAAGHPEICLHNPKDGLVPDARVTIPFEFELGGRKMIIELENMRQYKRWKGAAEAITRAQAEGIQLDPVAWLVKAISPEDVLYDIGANIGTITAIAAVTQPRMKIFSFEPEPNSFLQLCRMVRRNNIQALPYPFAISDRVLVDRFFINRNFEAALSQHQFGRTIDGHGKEFRSAFSFGAAAFSLDELVFVHRLPMPTVLKIDVDGIESKVIAGASQILASGRVHTIVVEVANFEEGEALTDLLSTYQYKCDVPRASYPTEGSFDLAFVRK